MSFLWNDAEPFIHKNLSTRSVFDNLGSTKMDVWRAVGREALLDNPEALLGNIGKIEYQKHFNDEKISKEEFIRDYGDSGLEYDQNMTKELVTYLLERKKQRQINEYIIASGEGGLVEAAGLFGTAVLSSFASPTNIALSFVPIGGQLRWAQFAAKYGKLAGAVARGATSGAVFQAGFEPVIAYSRNLEQRDYTLEDSITNIGVSATFAGMVNVGAYGIGKLKDTLKSNLSDINLRDVYMARKQLDEGKHIDLDVPHKAKSIYETGRNPELLEQKPEILEPKPELLEQDLDKASLNVAESPVPLTPIKAATEFIAKHQSKKIGFKEFLRQTELRSKTIASELLCGFMADLEKADIVYAFKTRFLGKAPYQDDMARELANLTTKEHPVGFTGSRAAAELAQIVHKWQTIALERANKAGAHINSLDGYITRQMHSGTAIRKMGYEKWRDFIVPLLDLEKTTAAYEGNIDFREIFNSLATGIHQNSGMSDYLGVNLAKKISAERKLHFNSADHWLIYNEKCGQYNLSDSILLNLQSLGKAIGLLDMLGDNPQHSFISLKNTFIEGLKAEAAAGNKYAISDINYLQSKKSDNIFDYIHGMHRSDNPSLAAIGQGVRAVKSMSSLGSVVIRSLPDIATWLGELSNQGIPILQSYRHLLTDLLKTMSSKQQKDFARNLGIASESMLGFAYDRLNVESQTLGVISKMTNLFFKLNCMDWWDNSFKSAMGLVLSKNLAAKVNKPFKQLPLRLQNQLARYGIDESNWHLYKHFKQKAGTLESGNDYYLIPDSGVFDSGVLDADIAENLANNLRRYFADRVDTAIATQQATEKAITMWGTKSGTGVGEFVRFFMQFKSFPIAYVMRSLNAATLERIPKIKRTGIFSEDLKLSLQNTGTITDMTHLLVASTVLGYLSTCAYSLLKLEELPDPEDPKVWVASVVKGGGLGIFGDFIFNEYDRYGRTFMQEASGPVISDINSIASIVAKAKSGNISKAEQESLKLLLHNIPGRNLFYLLPAITMIEKEYDIKI